MSILMSNKDAPCYCHIFDADNVRQYGHMRHRRDRTLNIIWAKSTIVQALTNYQILLFQSLRILHYKVMFEAQQQWAKIVGFFIETDGIQHVSTKIANSLWHTINSNRQAKCIGLVIIHHLVRP